jgi:uncharacterized membrane protein
MEYFLLFTWLLIGFVSFVYFWTKDFDFTYRELPAALLMSLCGILVVVIGYVVHGKSMLSNEIIIRKRNYE